jgi:hypothetical protein
VFSLISLDWHSNGYHLKGWFAFGFYHDFLHML